MLKRFAVLAFSIGLVGAGTGLAFADHDRDGEPEIFLPHATFKFDDGYYRTRQGHYYHYDRDRDGWHYGRDHREGMRWEKKHHSR